MEKQTSDNIDKKQKQYEQATRDLLMMFTDLFIATIATVLFLAAGMYAYYYVTKALGILSMALSAITFLWSVFVFFNIRQYIKLHNK